MCDRIPIRLVYHLYVPNGEFGSFMDVHWNCLRYYSHLFTESIFVLCMENPEDFDRIKSIEKHIIGLGFNNVIFKVIKNSQYREGLTLKNEVVDKMNDIDGLTFFAHSKGDSNLMSDNSDNLGYWISSMYYYNLEFLDIVKYKLIEGFYLASGFLVFVNKNILNNKFGYCFSGSFFWMNTQRLYDYIKLYGNGDTDYLKIFDRVYAENFIGNVAYLFKIWSPGRSTEYCDDYKNVLARIKEITYTDEIYNSFIDFHNKIALGNG